MDYTLGPDGRWVVNLHKSQLASWFGHSRPGSEIVEDPEAALLAGRAQRGTADLTISGLSGATLQPAPGGGGLAWRSEE